MHLTQGTAHGGEDGLTEWGAAVSATELGWKDVMVCQAQSGPSSLFQNSRAGAGRREGGREWMDWRWTHPGKVKARCPGLILREAGALVGFQNQRKKEKPKLLLKQKSRSK